MKITRNTWTDTEGLYYKLDGSSSWCTLGCLVENRDWWQAFMNVANESCGAIKCEGAPVVSVLEELGWLV
jgi:hypothetical protein